MYKQNRIILLLLFIFFSTTALFAQVTTNDPFPNPIDTTAGLVVVDVAEFAVLPGYGHFYTFTDVVDDGSPVDFHPGGGNLTHHTVIHEWRANNPRTETYIGDAPRELMRFQQPFGNHNAGQLAFYPLAGPGDDEYGLLYIGSADGGSGGDPLNLSLNLGSPFGKILRIDPLGSNSTNRQYSIPDSISSMRNPDPTLSDPVGAPGGRHLRLTGF
ncbi:MAG: hypothetical protein EA359_15550 [Balneolaceae bacterium]|nr:MAG: hypothetical protein EA359_15550 [Balneolaceae bacterium]